MGQDPSSDEDYGKDWEESLEESSKEASEVEIDEGEEQDSSHEGSSVEDCDGVEQGCARESQDNSRTNSKSFFVDGLASEKENLFPSSNSKENTSSPSMKEKKSEEKATEVALEDDYSAPVLKISVACGTSQPVLDSMEQQTIDAPRTTSDPQLLQDTGNNTLELLLSAINSNLEQLTSNRLEGKGTGTPTAIKEVTALSKEVQTELLTEATREKITRADAGELPNLSSDSATIGRTDGALEDGVTEDASENTLSGTDSIVEVRIFRHMRIVIYLYSLISDRHNLSD